MLTFTACSPPAAQEAPEAADDQQNEVYLPSTGSEVNTKDEGEAEAESEEAAYPASEQEMPASEPADVSQTEAYPEPVQEVAAADPYPEPEAEPASGPQPTPRGDELYASNPSNFSLASGQVQLVEMFAFW